MKTGSLVNHLYSRMTVGQPEVVVGMGCTILSWTDRHAGTVVEILKGGIVAVTNDTATRIDKNGMSESQVYEYTSNPDGHRTHFRFSKAGKWEEIRFNKETNRWNKTDGYGLRLGERDEYHDFSF